MAFYPLEITLDEVSKPSDHVPDSCSNSNLVGLLSSMFLSVPNSRPSAAEVLVSPYLKVHSQRELVAREAQISKEERAVRQRCDTAAAHEAKLQDQRKEILEQQRDVHQQLAESKMAHSKVAEESEDLRRRKEIAMAEQLAKTADLQQLAAALRLEQADAAAEHARLGEERAKILSVKALVVAPAYWDASDLNDSTPTQQVDVTAEMIDSVRWVMNATAKPQFHGQGRDSHGAAFDTFEPIKIWRIENHQLWRAYVLRRDAVRASVGGSPIEVVPTPATATLRLPSGARVDKQSNEHLLFHGTKPDAVSTLCNRGFDEHVGSLAGFLGAGCYFAENSSKSDEYVPPGAKQYMFLSRVVLGTPFVTPATAGHRGLRRPPCVHGHFDMPGRTCGHDRFNSLVATTKATDLRSSLHHFREFVVYDRSQCYPEYLIEYERR